MRLIILLFCHVITISTIHAQYSKAEILNESYSSIYNKLIAAKGDSIQQRFFLEAYMQKARNENNIKKIITGYKYLRTRATRKTKPIYADSVVKSALATKDTILISSAYLSKGIVFYWNKQYEKALDNYILSFKYLNESKSEDPYLTNKLSYNMGLVKYYLGMNQDALTTLKPCLEYFELHHQKAYLVTLNFIGICYMNLGNYVMTSKINRQGIEKGKEIGNRSVEVYFRKSEAINQYYKGNYQTTIDSLEAVIPTIDDRGDFANVTLSQYYIGKSYWDLNQRKTAIPYLELVDQSITENNYLKKEVLKSYTMLEQYYLSIGDSTNYLKYLEKQNLFTNMLLEQQRILFPKLAKEYDQIKLNKTKEKPEQVAQESEPKNGLLWVLILGGTLLLALLLWFYFRNIYPKNLFKKQRTDELNSLTGTSADVPSDKDFTKDVDSKTKTVKGGASSVVVREKSINIILEHLDAFEKGKKYVDKNMSIVYMANKFGTNVTYLSHVLNNIKKKSFNDYINELRIDHIIEYAKNNADKEPTIKELTEVGGFTNPRKFRQVLKSKTGMLPSDFLKALKDGTLDQIDHMNRKPSQK